MYQETNFAQSANETITNGGEDSCFDVPLQTIRDILSELKIHRDPSKLQIHWEVDEHVLKKLK